MSRIYALSSVKFLGLKLRLCKIMTNIRYLHIFINFLFLLSKFLLSSCHLVSMLPPFPTKEKGNKSCWRWRLSPAPIIPTPMHLSLWYYPIQTFFYCCTRNTMVIYPQNDNVQKYLARLPFIFFVIQSFLGNCSYLFPLETFQRTFRFGNFSEVITFVNWQSYSLVQFPRYVQYTKALETFHIEPNSHVPQFQPVLVFTGRSWPKFSKFHNVKISKFKHFQHLIFFKFQNCHKFWYFRGRLWLRASCCYEDPSSARTTRPAVPTSRWGRWLSSSLSRFLLYLASWQFGYGLKFFIWYWDSEQKYFRSCSLLRLLARKPNSQVQTTTTRPTYR